jgi:hypothetical protein
MIATLPYLLCSQAIATSIANACCCRRATASTPAATTKLQNKMAQAAADHFGSKHTHKLKAAA